MNFPSCNAVRIFTARWEESIWDKGVLNMFPKFIMPSPSKQQGTTVPSVRIAIWSSIPWQKPCSHSDELLSLGQVKISEYSKKIFFASL